LLLPIAVLVSPPAAADIFASACGGGGGWYRRPVAIPRAVAAAHASDVDLRSRKMSTTDIGSCLLQLPSPPHRLAAAPTVELLPLDAARAETNVSKEGLEQQGCS
jgi:hypothetical protein